MEGANITREDQRSSVHRRTVNGSSNVCNMAIDLRSKGIIDA